MKIANFINFFREVRFEGNKVVWPMFKETLTASFLVFIVVLIASLFFLMIDGVIYKMMGYILTKGD